VILAVLLHAVFFGFLTAWLAERKGHRVSSWFVLGVALGALATLVLLLQPDEAVDAAHDPAR
jgi:MFS family permease